MDIARSIADRFKDNGGKAHWNGIDATVSTISCDKIATISNGKLGTMIRLYGCHRTDKPTVCHRVKVRINKILALSPRKGTAVWGDKWMIVHFADRDKETNPGLDFKEDGWGANKPPSLMIAWNVPKATTA